jgi:hypothetical protein
MTRFRTQVLAALGATLLVALSVSTAFGAHPETADSENLGHQVSGYVHWLQLASHEDSQGQTDEEQQEDQQDEQTEDEQTQEDQQDQQLPTEDAAANSHGQCVRDVAQGSEVGGPNDNHGGAVSLAARVTCWQTDTTDGGDGSDPTTVSDGPGNSENHGSHGNHGNGGNKH